MGFGADSVIKSLSGALLLWRLQSHEADEAREQRALKLVGWTFLVLAAYVAFEAGRDLFRREEPETSLVGMGLAVASLIIMPVLARAKRRVVARLDSRAMVADSRQTDLCAWLSVILLGELGLNAVWGWWWADPVAALVMVPIIVREGLEALRGETCDATEGAEAPNADSSVHGTFCPWRGMMRALCWWPGRRTPPSFTSPKFPTKAGCGAAKSPSPMPQSETDPLAGRIHTIRGQRVILDSDLARLYSVPTFRFNEAVKRNAEKFPEDFRFQLTKEETENLISQFAISSADSAGDERDRPISSQSAMTARHGGRRKFPWAFTEHGCLMAATVLNSTRAVQMSLYVIRAFVQMREALATNATILRRLTEIDKTLLEHNTALLALWKKLRPLLAPPPEPAAKEMGFHVGMKKPHAKRGESG